LFKALNLFSVEFALPGQVLNNAISPFIFCLHLSELVIGALCLPSDPIELPGQLVVEILQFLCFLISQNSNLFSLLLLRLDLTGNILQLPFVVLVSFPNILLICLNRLSFLLLRIELPLQLLIFLSGKFFNAHAISFFLF
jgi:hypothetical protein